MANNPYVNKVIYNNQTLIDLTADTVDAAHLAQGYTAHDLSGQQIIGTMTGGSGSIQIQTFNGTLPNNTTGSTVDIWRQNMEDRGATFSLNLSNYGVSANYANLIYIKGNCLMFSKPSIVGIQRNFILVKNGNNLNLYTIKNTLNKSETTYKWSMVGLDNTSTASDFPLDTMAISDAITYDNFYIASKNYDNSGTSEKYWISASVAFGNLEIATIQ